jgi:hypothetical protein
MPLRLPISALRQEPLDQNKAVPLSFAGIGYPASNPDVSFRPDIERKNR